MRAVLGDIEELAAQMIPTESERDRLAAWFVGDGLVGRVSVALDDAAVILEQLPGVDRAATGRVAVGDRGRIGSAPRPVVAGDRPEVDGVTGLHRASRSLASALWVARSLAAGLCGRVVVPQTEDVIKRSRASPLQGVVEGRP